MGAEGRLGTGEFGGNEREALGKHCSDSQSLFTEKRVLEL